MQGKRLMMAGGKQGNLGLNLSTLKLVLRGRC